MLESVSFMGLPATLCYRPSYAVFRPVLEITQQAYSLARLLHKIGLHGLLINGLPIIIVGRHVGLIAHALLPLLDYKAGDHFLKIFQRKFFAFESKQVL